MMLANDLKTYYDEVRRYLDCPKDEQDRLLLSVNKQVIELQVDNPNLDYDGIVEFLGEPESLAASLMERLSPDVVQKFKKKWYYCGCNRYRILEKPCKRLELYQPQNHND